MKIRTIMCDQFAGINNAEISFQDNLNILLGANETGKSTIIDLIYYMFFQNTKMDKRSDKSFIKLYFPKSVGTVQGDYINGVITFETGKGRYRLEKEWAQEGDCKLVCPDGTRIKDTRSVNKIVSEELIYGKGIYDEFVFPSQKRDQLVLSELMSSVDVSNKKDSSEKVLDEVSSVITKAMMETGGVSIEKLVKSIEQIITSYNGNWDFRYDKPKDGNKRGILNPWKNNVGKILQAYYAMERAKESYDKTYQAEKKIEEINTKLKKEKSNRDKASEELSSFENAKRAILLKSLIEHLKDEIKKMMEINSNWPVLEKELRNAELLKRVYGKAEAYSQLEEIRGLQSEIVQLENEKNTLCPVSKIEIKKVEDLYHSIIQVQAQLDGLKNIKMGLYANIQNNSLKSVSVSRITDGAKIKEIKFLEKANITVDEAIEISLKDELHIQLLPNKASVTSYADELVRLKAEFKKIMRRFDIFIEAENLDSFRNAIIQINDKNTQFQDVERKIADRQNRIKLLLNGRTMEDLENNLKRARITAEKIENSKIEIQNLCGKYSLDTYIGRKQAVLENYKSLYESREHLKTVISSKKQELAIQKENLAQCNRIPARFKEVIDTEEYENELRIAVENYDTQIEEYRTLLSTAIANIGEKSAEEYDAEKTEKENLWNNRKKEYAKWIHIYEVVMRMKQELESDPLKDIEKRFRDYLNEITNGGISLESVSDNLHAELVSKSHPLMVETLSEGTRDTVLLAFRLAVLESLYPNGGGLAVFDDSFTDMDPVRTEQACKLVQKFAEKNQVIFATCDEKYTKLLNGHLIHVV